MGVLPSPQSEWLHPIPEMFHGKMESELKEQAQTVLCNDDKQIHEAFQIFCNLMVSAPDSWSGTLRCVLKSETLLL